VTVTRRTRAPVRALSVLAVAGLIVYAAQAIFTVCGSGANDFFEIYVYSALIAVGAVLCLIRAATIERERGAWLALGLGLVAWAAGEAAYSILYGEALESPMPSVSDFLWLALYPGCYVAIVRPSPTADVGSRSVAPAGW
jgi:peptidoglycan/LPS O-acetylase OafA/YrhL